MIFTLLGLYRYSFKPFLTISLFTKNLFTCLFPVPRYVMAKIQDMPMYYRCKLHRKVWSVDLAYLENHCRHWAQCRIKIDKSRVPVSLLPHNKCTRLIQGGLGGLVLNSHSSYGTTCLLELLR